MEDADNLIAQALAQSGWLKEVSHLAIITGAELVPIVGWALGRIDGENDIVVEYPKGVAQRHRIAAELAGKIKTHGYNGECGYNHLLYPTEADTRQLLLWLVQKLPKVESDDIEEDTPEKLLRKKFGSAMIEWMNNANQKVAKKLIAKATPLPNIFSKPASTARTNYIATMQPFITSPQLLSENKMLSLIELNYKLTEPANDMDLSTQTLDIKEKKPIPKEVAAAIKQLTRMPQSPLMIPSLSVLPGVAQSLPTPIAARLPPSIAAEKLKIQDFVRSAVDTEAIEKQKEQVEAFRIEFEANRTAIEGLQSQIATNTTLKTQMDFESQYMFQEIEAVQYDLGIRQQTLDMVADAANNISKLQGMCEAGAERLKSMAQEWEVHQQPYKKQIASDTLAQQEYEEECLELRSTIIQYQQDIKSLVETIAAKKAQKQSLERKYAAMPKTINRSMYTSRIMDIIKQVHKQKADIAKILVDIRSVQKQINLSSEKLKRSEAIAEERLFRAANDPNLRGDKKATYVECYRLFTTVRELFDELIRYVTEGGKAENQIRDLTTWITQLSNRLNVSNLERIQQDLAQVRSENNALLARLQP
ncbi:coiled-coil domain-containing protein 22-like [Thraustotheca clavata]|uniref:Coiled-coil domain-containing protein 22-like n=1 Tax=Thraustotheca clavata TaxID=74557 RepID=A0A1V9YVN7_9STRA|nr:coiled-coil domain-containing protein 22-like [Thraustotheca clavata]